MLFYFLKLEISLLWLFILRVNGQCTITDYKDSSTGTDGDVLEVLQQLEQNLKADQQNLLNRFEKIAMNAIENFTSRIQSSVNCQQSTDVVYDCFDIKSNGSTGSGVYRIHVDHQRKRYSADAYCDMTTANSQWLVFQRRKDASVDFYRGWTEYEKGFGDPNGNFWLGNEILHLFTSKRKYRLRIDLEDFEGQKRYAEYSTFEIGPASDNYRLKVRGYSGDAGSSFQQHSDAAFSTYDLDNDLNAVTCAYKYRGGWWYHWYDSCYDTNLNGVYHRGNYSTTFTDGITWDGWLGLRYSLKTTEMKISALP